MVCISTVEVLFAFCVSPPYDAVSDADPNGNLVVTNVAVAVESSFAGAKRGSVLKFTEPACVNVKWPICVNARSAELGWVRT